MASISTTTPKIQNQSQQDKSTQQWFIFQAGRHLGPFDRHHLVKLYDQGVLDEKTPVWCRGEKNWSRLHLHPAFAGEIMPPLPAKQEREQAVVRPVAISPSDEKRQERQAKVEAAMNEASKTTAQSPLQNFRAHFDRLRQLRFSEQFQYESKLYLKVLSIVFFFIFSYFLVESLFSQRHSGPEQEVLTGLSQKNHQRLYHLAREVETTPHFQQASFDMAAHLQGQQIWLATNWRPTQQEGLATLKIELHSNVELTLASTPVHLTASAQLTDGLAHFHSFRIERGHAIAAGVYDFKILAPDNVRLSGQILLGNLSASELSQRLQQANLANMQSLNDYLELREQFLATYQRALSDFYQLVAASIENVNLLQFQKDYAQYIAPVIQQTTLALMRENQEGIDQLALDELLSLMQNDRAEDHLQLSQLNRQFIQLGQSLGSWSVQWSEHLKELPSGPLNASQKARLDALSYAHKNELNDRMERLRSSLQQVSVAFQQHIAVADELFQTHIHHPH